MHALHIINQSPFTHSALQSCLRIALPASPIIFIENGVIATLTNTDFSQQLIDTSQNHPLYALSADVIARGLSEKLLDCIQLIDYDGFVELSLQHNPIHTWN